MSQIPLELSLRTPGPYSNWLYMYICALCSPWCCRLLLVGVWVPVLCVLAFVPLWIAQMITGLVPCVNHCARVLFIQGSPRSFVWVLNLCICYVFVWSSSPCLYTKFKKLLRIPASVSQSFMPTWQLIEMLHNMSSWCDRKIMNSPYLLDMKQLFT
jgi:hypothetical protein